MKFISPISPIGSIILSVLFFLLPAGCPQLVHADPFLTCDDQEGVTKYRFVTSHGAEIIDATPEGAVLYDLAQLPIGETSAELSAGAPWTIDGIPQDVIEWSESRPFVLGRPGVLQSPSSIGLKNE